MRRDGWLSVAHLRDDGETLAILLRPGKRQANRGLAVILHEADKLMVVSLIGDERLDFFNDYMSNDCMSELDVDAAPVEIDPATLEARVSRRGPAAGTGR